MLIFKKVIICSILLWSTQSIAFQEFLYPIALLNHDNKQKICVLYQKNSHLELWFWDPESLEAVKGLLSSFTPAGVRVLPHGKAFSFIDNDRIRIKDITKRSPCTLDLPYGPYDLSTLEWIDNESFYFCAREREHLNLFHATTEGELFHLTRSKTNHYSYPQKIDDTLFYIVKNDEGEIALEQAEYPIKKIPKYSWHNEKQNFEEQLKTLFEEEKDNYTKTYLDDTTKQKLYIWKESDKELAFLCMKDTNRGYFLTHPTIINKNDDYMTFECYRFINQSETIIKKLFTFNIPLYLLMPQHNQPERLYESILPLLPLYHQDSIYYAHDSGLGLALYKYDEITEQNQALTQPDNNHHFAPFCYEDKIYYGGTVSDGDGLSHTSPEMWINEQGNQRFVFPIL